MRFIQRAAVVAAMTAAGAAMTAAPAFAAGGTVQRYQTSTTNYTFIVDGTYEHDITVVTNPCNGTSTTTGVINVNGYGTETATITNNGDGTFTLAAVYDANNGANSGYTWGGTFPVGGGDGTSLSGGGVYAATASVLSSSTSYANHGQYVSSAGGGSDAAHSCIGMPVQSNG